LASDVRCEDNAASRRYPAGGPRKLPLAPAHPRTHAKQCPLFAGIPAYTRSARKRHDRPVTPEVAGSSPVAPIKLPANRLVFARLDRRLLYHPALIPLEKSPAYPAPRLRSPGIPASWTTYRTSRRSPDGRTPKIRIRSVLASVGSVGDAYDNTESFLDSFKSELIADRVWSPGHSSSWPSSSTSAGTTAPARTRASATSRRRSTSSRRPIEDQLRSHRSDGVNQRNRSPSKPVRLTAPHPRCDRRRHRTSVVAHQHRDQQASRTRTMGSAGRGIRCRQ
jgi:hypothetical protein